MNNTILFTYYVHTQLHRLTRAPISAHRVGSRAGQRAVGNAVCTAMSKAIMQCAISIQTGKPVPLLPPSSLQTAEPSLPDEDEAPPPQDSRKLQRRLKSIETLLRELHSQAHV